MMNRALCSFLLLLSFFACSRRPLSDAARGREQFAAGNYHAAIDSWEKDLVHYPDNYESLCHIGLAYEKLGDSDKAEDTFRKTISLNPVNACAFLGFARIYAAQKRWGESWDAFTRAVGIAANEELLRYLPALRAAFDGGVLDPAVASIDTGGSVAPATVIVAVRVTPATIQRREELSVGAATDGDRFTQAFYTALAATARDRIGLCHDHFFAKSLPAALDARFTLAVGPDGRVISSSKKAAADGDADMKDCVATALSTIRFPAADLSGTK